MKLMLFLTDDEICVGSFQSWQPQWPQSSQSELIDDESIDWMMWLPLMVLNYVVIRASSPSTAPKHDGWTWPVTFSLLVHNY